MNAQSRDYFRLSLGPTLYFTEPRFFISYRQDRCCFCCYGYCCCCEKRETVENVVVFRKPVCSRGILAWRTRDASVVFLCVRFCPTEECPLRRHYRHHHHRFRSRLTRRPHPACSAMDRPAARIHQLLPYKPVLARRQPKCQRPRQPLESTIPEVNNLPSSLYLYSFPYFLCLNSAFLYVSFGCCSSCLFMTYTLGLSIEKMLLDFTAIKELLVNVSITSFSLRYTSRLSTCLCTVKLF